MECGNKDAIELIAGSKNEFDLILSEDGRPFNLTPYTMGANLVFMNNSGVRTAVVLIVPGAWPEAGIIPVVISAIQAGDMDSKWASADLELKASSSADDKVIPLTNKFEIVNRNTPAL